MKTRQIKRLLALVLCLCMTAALLPVSAGAAGVDPEFNITVSANPDKGGGVSGGKEYTAGTEATVQAVSSPAYQFLCWSESGQPVSTDISYKFIVDRDRTLTAEFVPGVRYTVKVEDGTGGGQYHFQEPVTVTADPPPEGKCFEKWTVVSGGVTIAEDDAKKSAASFSMLANEVEIRADYKNLPQDHHSITVLTDGGGTAVASVNSSEADKDITLTATADAGWHFQRWHVLAGGGGELLQTADNNSASFTMPRDNVILKAIFVPNTNTEVTTHKVAVYNGQGSGNYAAGETVTITADPPPFGHYFTGWQISDDGPTLADSAAQSTSFTMPDNDVTVTAITEYMNPEGVTPPPQETYYSIAVLNDGRGIANADKNRAEQGERITLTAAPNEGYRFKAWEPVSGGVTVGDNGFTMPAENVVLRATFEPIPSEETNYTVTLAAEPGAGGTVAGGGTYADGTLLSVRAAADSNYKFLRWTEDGQAVSRSALYTFTLNRDRSLTAVFAQTYTVTVNSGTGGGSYAAGESVSITANAAEVGKYFAGWTVNDGGVTLPNAASAGTSFTMPGNNVEVTATYAALGTDEYAVTVLNDGNGTASADKYKASAGDSVKLTATPKEGYRFKEWTVESGNITVANNDFTMPGNNVTVKAHFEPVTQYPVTVRNSYAPLSGEGRYAAEETVAINAGSRAGYAFDGWTAEAEDGDVTLANAADASTTFTMPASAVTVQARWRLASGGDPGGVYYTITAAAEAGGAISPQGRVTAARGADKAFTVTPDKGYRISDVLVDGESVGAVNRYVFEKVRRDHSIKAVFVPVREPAGPGETGVGDWLNTEDHLAYLQGYPGNLFGPDRNMTRAEVAQMFYNLLLDKDVTITTGFDDVAGDAWYATAVNTLASLGILKGVGENRYEPDRPVTRAEFTAIAMRFAKLPVGGENPFHDVAEDAWYYPYVVGAVQYAWIEGYPDGSFRPNNAILRSEVATIVNRMLGRVADRSYIDANRAALTPFGDLETSHWAYYDIMEATNGHRFAKENASETWVDLLP